MRVKLRRTSPTRIELSDRFVETRLRILQCAWLFFSFFPLRDGFSFDREFHSNAAWPRFVSFLCFRLFYSPREITAICILKLRIVAVWDSRSFYWTRTFVLVEKYSETVCWFKTLLEAVKILWRFVFQASLYPSQYYEIFRLDKFLLLFHRWSFVRIRRFGHFYL